jgi:hypothetical protein
MGVRDLFHGATAGEVDKPWQFDHSAWRILASIAADHPPQKRARPQVAVSRPEQLQNANGVNRFVPSSAVVAKGRAPAAIKPATGVWSTEIIAMLICLSPPASPRKLCSKFLTSISNLRASMNAPLARR